MHSGLEPDIGHFFFFFKMYFEVKIQKLYTIVHQKQKKLSRNLYRVKNYGYFNLGSIGLFLGFMQN